MKRFGIILFLLGLFFPLVVKGETPGTMAGDAERSYQNGDYAGAARRWEELLSLGFINGNLLYNLGNAAWESGQGGRARWYYLRALPFNPRDGNLRNNLAFVENRLGLKTQSPEDGPWGFFKSLPWWKLSLSFFETLRVTAVLGAFLFGFLLWRRLRKKPASVWIRLTAGIPLGALWVVLLWQGGALYFTRRAVILKPDLPLLSAPSPEAKTGQVLPEGSLVSVQKRQGNFWLAKIPGGNSAWLNTEGVGEIRL